MNPAPVGVDNDLTLGSRAAAAGTALGPAQLRVSLRLESAGLLGRGSSQDGEQSKSQHDENLRIRVIGGFAAVSRSWLVSDSSINRRGRFI